MRRSLKHLDQLCHASRGPFGRQADLFWFNPKLARLGWRGCLLKPGTKQLVYRLLQRLTSAAYLLFEEAGYIVVEGKSSSHIMMIPLKHHDVKSRRVSFNTVLRLTS